MLCLASIMFLRFRHVEDVSALHSSSWPNDIPLCGYSAFVYLSPTDGHLGYFHLLAKQSSFVNRAAINIHEQVSARTRFSLLLRVKLLSPAVALTHIYIFISFEND